MVFTLAPPCTGALWWHFIVTLYKTSCPILWLDLLVKKVKFLIDTALFYIFFIVLGFYKRLFTITFTSWLSLCHSFMSRSHSLSHQLHEEHTGQGLSYPGFSQIGMHIFGQSPHSWVTTCDLNGIAVIKRPKLCSQR